MPLLPIACSLALVLGAQDVQGPLVSVPHVHHRVDSPFWRDRLKALRGVTLPALLDRIEAEGYLDNFDQAAAGAGPTGGAKHVGGPEADVLVYRVLEAGALLLEQEEDAALGKRLEAWVARIVRAQAKDGHLATYAALTAPGTRFADVRTGRELFCAGGLLEAGLAWQRATGKRDLLDAGLGFARLVDETFHGEGERDPPGRQGLELALVHLFHETQEEGWLWLADDLLSRRGSSEGRTLWGEDVQDLVEVRKQRLVEGDVLGQLTQGRAMIETYAATGEYALLSALIHQVRDLSERHMHVTGGLGRVPHGRFGPAYDLAPARAAAEPAAATELVLLLRRMLTMTRQAAYADLEETVLYNALAAGLGPDGQGFLASSPLEVRSDVGREAWPDPPHSAGELVRFLPRLGEGTYAHDQDELYLCHYLAGETELRFQHGSARVIQKTNYPWDGRVEVRIRPEKPMRLTVHARVPAWVQGSFEAGVDDAVSEVSVDRGDDPGTWVNWQRLWTGEETLILNFPMPVERVRADERVAAAAGRVALRRGPLVFALEGVDNDGHTRDVVLDPGAEVEAAFDSQLLGGAMALGFSGRIPGDGGTFVPRPIRAIPYALWGNRGPSNLTVWLPESPDGAALDDAVIARAGGVTLRASHCYRADDLASILDGVVPKSSSDPTHPRMTFRPRRGGEEWLELEFEAPRLIERLSVYWVADKAKNGLRAPRSWRVLWDNGGSWLPCRPTEGSSWLTSLDKPVEVSIEPVSTLRLRLELRQRSGYSAGLFAWTAKERR